MWPSAAERPQSVGGRRPQELDCADTVHLDCLRQVRRADRRLFQVVVDDVDVALPPAAELVRGTIQVQHLHKEAGSGFVLAGFSRHDLQSVAC